MEGEKSDCSTFSVPGAMSDVTILSTPMPRAASTATKRRSPLEESRGRGTAMERLINEYDEMVEGCMNDFPTARYHPLPPEPNYSFSKVKSPIKSNRGNNTNTNIQKSISPNSNINLLNKLSEVVLRQDHTETKTRNKSSVNVQNRNAIPTEVERFKIPAVPQNKPPSSKVNQVKQIYETISTKNSTGNKSSMNIQNTNPLPTSEVEPFKVPAAPPMSRLSQESSLTKSLDIHSSNFQFPESSTEHGNSRDSLEQQLDRVSLTSSTNSSLGLISSDVLYVDIRQLKESCASTIVDVGSPEGSWTSTVVDIKAFKEPLVDVTEDLSLRLAQQLNLDTSLLKDGMDLSTLAGERYSERYRQKLAAKYENKENRQSSGSRSSSVYSASLHGYSSDTSDSKNNTAKRRSALSTGSGGEAGTPRKSWASTRRSLQPLSEMNYANEDFTSSKRSGRSSFGSNPFGGYSNVSVNSDDFGFNEKAAERLEREERQFSMASARSLSGIYGDSSACVNVGGEKLSISSFLRGGSYPLGSLETGASDAQSPQFGLQTNSPEKKGGPRAILPLPQDKSTFVVEEEEPVRDTPWAPQSLIEQYSNIHSETDADVSVPSLSLIGEMLDKLHHGANATDILAQLMGSQNKTMSKPDNSMRPSRISSVVEGDDSFCKGVEVEQRFSAKSVISSVFSNGTEVSSVESICNVTDFDGDGEEDACVCVLTTQSMDFDICNELKHPVEYGFTKACYVNGTRKDAAAFVHIPVSKLMLYPGQKRTLTINIAALVAGVIKIKIEVSRRNPLTQAVERSNVYGKIVAELPMVSMLTGMKEEMIPRPDCEYNGKYQHTIVMKNMGRSSVPLKLNVIKVEDDDTEFYFDERSKKTVSMMLEPGQAFRQLVQCETPPVFAHLAPPDTVIPVEAKVECFLATTELYQLRPVEPVTLIAPLRPYFFGAPAELGVPSILTLYNGSDRPVPFSVATAAGYTAYPPRFTVPPNGTFVVTVGMVEMRYPQRNETLTLSASYPVGKTLRYSIQLRENHRSSLSSNNSLVTPHSSRATSPTSLSSSHPGVELRVACSHKQLVWGGCCLHRRVVKSFCLKNTGQQREKLRLTTSGMCFQIQGEEDMPLTELKLSLEPMENRDIKVAVLATVVGPQWGHLTVSRISRASDRSVLPLKAFGGKSAVMLKGGVLEIKNEKYLVLEGNPLKGFFVLTNSGNNAAFFRISEAHSKSSTGLSISPQEGVLAAGQTLAVYVCLSVTAQRLEYLLRQPGSSVRAAQLSVHWGDESTRQRLLRTRGLHGVMAARVAQLARIPSTPLGDLDKLDASPDVAEELWEEDMEECTLEVIVKRTALETLRLDISEVYVDMSKTMSKPLE